MTTTTNAKPAGITQKLTGLFGSMRFWQVTLSAVAYGVANPDKIPETVSVWLAAVAAIGTVDKIAETVAVRKQ